MPITRIEFPDGSAFHRDFDPSPVREKDGEFGAKSGKVGPTPLQQAKTRVSNVSSELKRMQASGKASPEMVARKEKALSEAQDALKAHIGSAATKHSPKSNTEIEGLATSGIEKGERSREGNKTTGPLEKTPTIGEGVRLEQKSTTPPPPKAEPPKPVAPATPKPLTGERAVAKSESEVKKLRAEYDRLGLAIERAKQKAGYASKPGVAADLASKRSEVSTKLYEANDRLGKARLSVAQPGV